VTKSNKIALAVIRSSLVWGGLASLGFYALLHAGLLRGDGFQRYFAGHWVEYVETVIFFVGLSELVLRAFDIAEQSSAIKEPLLGARPAEPRPAIEAIVLLDRLAELPNQRQTHYLPRRLREALEWVSRKGSADTLDEQLKFLADVDADRAHSGYALVRLIIWAIPILGFLGTVIGITIAIAQLAPQALEASLPEVTKGLGVAFDTTALALGLSMVLMFGQFQVDRMERRLLDEVDVRAAGELAGRFEQLGDANPHLGVVRRMAETVLKATERIVGRQAELWKTTIDSAHQRWSDLNDTTQRQLEAALGKGLTQSLQAHAQQLTEAEAAHSQRNHEHWDRIQKALTETTQATRSQQAELVKQGEVLMRVVEATGQVARLEESLNKNLASLAGAQHFDETMLNLSAAIHLLNARLGQLSALAPSVALKETAKPGRAA
jgi:MotA/TolQ/ExbB proton channel family